jgi:hypothetical protein
MRESRWVVRLLLPPLKYRGFPYFSPCMPRNLTLSAVHTLVFLTLALLLPPLPLLGFAMPLLSL